MKAATGLLMQVRDAPLLAKSLTPFLYPCLHRPAKAHPVWGSREEERGALRSSSRRCNSSTPPRRTSQAAPPVQTTPPIGLSEAQSAHLNPSPSSYSITPFTDRCLLTVHAGDGGHGCVSFLREKYIPEGPPNGGDGGNGGSVYIQAVPGETSLHKLARRGIVKAGRGKNGRGSSRGGERGADVLISVPVGTIVREVERFDPIEEQEARLREARRQGLDADDTETAQSSGTTGRENFIIYPGPLKPSDSTAELAPRLKPRRLAIAAAEPASPIRLDLSTAMKQPMLLSAGAVGGLGNPHFITSNMRRPKYASKGAAGTQISLHLELKVLADVGLVGLPNAGKSTLLRALTNSRTRVGDWAFTTLQPSIGTVVLDDHTGRPDPLLHSVDAATGAARSSFTIADIPGLVEDAHEDKGLGLGFLKHVERAAVLAFVVDLGAGDAVAALRALWREVGAYEAQRAREVNAETEARLPPHLRQPDGAESAWWTVDVPPPISAKPWFVVATKADLPGTQANFAALAQYVDELRLGRAADGSSSPAAHPSGNANAWRKGVRAVPVSAVRAEGVERIPRLVVELLR